MDYEKMQQAGDGSLEKAAEKRRLARDRDKLRDPRDLAARDLRAQQAAKKAK